MYFTNQILNNVYGIYVQQSLHLRKKAIVML